MIHKLMMFRCADNSGAKFLKTIQLYGKPSKGFTKLGNFVRVIAKRVSFDKKVKRKKHYLGLALTTKALITRKDGSQYYGGSRKMIVFNETYKFQGTRVYGYALKESISSVKTISKAPKSLKYLNKQL